MHRALAPRWLRSALSAGDRAALAELPSYLCPALSTPAFRSNSANPATKRARAATQQHRCLHARSATDGPSLSDSLQVAELPRKSLPMQCHGCGGFAQSTDPDQAGYYDLNRRAVRRYLGLDREDGRPESDKIEEDMVVQQALGSLDSAKLAELGIDASAFTHGDELDPHGTLLPKSTTPTPLCDRCHKLVHNRVGTPIFHPTTDALRDTIEESPFKYNHVYHIIDAADFPMSLIPRLHQLLGDISLRRKNRRSRTGRFYGDRQIEMSFVITRSDLLAPTEKQVNALMPWMREVLRDALGDIGQSIRLGNLKCVSAKRSWWTKELKQDIYQRGGAGWMVGKVNVGKSQLFEAVFPKGTTMDTRSRTSGPVEVSMFAREENVTYIEEDGASGNDDDRLEVGALLPPARPETNYPDMPTVSSLPGTTASPIRIPYGNGKGELIDLPGLARSDLELYVREDARQSIIMQKRIKPKQHSLTPGKSLLLGGLIRITPRTPGLVFLGYNFTPLQDHMTSASKAEAFQLQTRPIEGLDNIATPEAAAKIAHAGAFKLRHDVTRLRAGPITRSDAIGIKVERLPYRVLSTDILIEGVGWVEITAQMRLKDLHRPPPEEVAPTPPPPPPPAEPEKPKDPFAAMEALIVDHRGGKKAAPPAPAASEPKRPVRQEPAKPKEPELNWPVVDVYSPLGKFISCRAPMNGWMLNKPLKQAKHMKSRPRKSMKGAKKAAKKAARAAKAASA